MPPLVDAVATTERKRKRNQGNKDPERLRLERAHATASSDLLFLPHSDSTGVGKFCLTTQQRQHDICKAMKDLFRTIVKHIARNGSGGGGVTWDEGPHNKDPRRRMYGFLPRKRQVLLAAGIKIQKEGAHNEEEHDYTLQDASVDILFQDKMKLEDHSELDDSKRESSSLIVDTCLYDALVAITLRVQKLVPEKYKEYVTMDQLVAAQPNLHNGANYLPAHLDFPRSDGFGVVIVTVAIQGHGDIILIDDGDEGTNDQPVSYSFPMKENECYILCGDARNKYVHGVLCSATKSTCQRETLNLRYGLHSPEFARAEVDQYWPE